jgi:hypothetical protein
MRQAVHYHNWDKIGTLGIGNAGSIQLTNGVYTVSIPQQRYQYYSQGEAYQGDYLGEYKSAFLDSSYRIMVGYDYGYDDSIPLNAQSSTVAAPRQPLLTFNRTDPGLSFAPLASAGVVNSGERYGVFIEPGAHFFGDRLQITAGLRDQWSSNKAKNRVNGTVTTSHASYPLIPRLSVLYKPVNWLSVYYLHTENVSPTSVINEYTLLPANDPRNGLTLTLAPKVKQDEVGLKGTLLNNRVLFTFSAYQIDIVSGAGTNYYNEVINGATTTIGRSFLQRMKLRGYELEIFGEPIKHLTMIAAIGYGNGSNQLGLNTFVKSLNCESTVALYLKYNFGKSSASGLSAIFGGKALLSGWNMQPTFTMVYPENQYVMDAGLSYGFKARGRQYTFTVKVNNLANKLFVQPYNTRLEMRQAFATLATKF